MPEKPTYEEFDPRFTRIENGLFVRMLLGESQKCVKVGNRHFRIAGFLRYITLALLIASTLIISTASAQTNLARKILVIHSYHQGFTWTDNVMAGIEAVFEESDLHVELFVEYIDTKRHEPEKVFPYLEEIYKFKYQNNQPDVIILSDNNALNFLLASRERLFPGVPVVFCGINNFDDSLIAGKEQITGVAEDFDLKGTIELALRLHPRTKRIAAISDITPTGVINLERVRQTMLQFKDAVEFMELAKLSVDELKEALRGLPSNTVLLKLSFYRDRKGKFFCEKESTHILTESCDLPIYSLWDWTIAHGVLGGMVINGRLQGENAARMAKMILHGESADAIPILRESPNIPMFDYTQMKRFGLSQSDLPKDSIVINKPVSFYWEHRKLVWGVIGMIMSLSVIILILYFNIFQRQRAEEAIRKSEQSFRDLVENSLTGISIIQNNQIVYQNPEDMRLIGSLIESFRHSDFEHVHPDDVEKVKEFYQKAISGEDGNLDIDFRFYPHGKKSSKANMRWVQCRANLVRYQDGKATLLNMTDITRTKELEHLVIMQDKMASLGCIAAGIGHEIRNPLTGITTYLYTLEEVCNSDPIEPENLEMVRQIIGQIKVASNKIESVIRRVMDFSRPSSHEGVLVDINQSLQEAINLSSVTLRKVKIKIEKSLAQDLPQCYANPNLIEQVVLNLINNATKAMENTDGTKNMKITSSSENGSIIVRISDSGPGVPFENRDKIFDPFFTTRDGMGIGLSIVHRIITDHGGSIYVDTSEWGGAEFRIELPIEKRRNSR